MPRRGLRSIVSLAPLHNVVKRGDVAQDEKKVKTKKLDHESVHDNAKHPNRKHGNEGAQVTSEARVKGVLALRPVQRHKHVNVIATHTYLCSQHASRPDEQAIKWHYILPTHAIVQPNAVICGRWDGGGEGEGSECWRTRR